YDNAIEARDYMKSNGLSNIYAESARKAVMAGSTLSKERLLALFKAIDSSSAINKAELRSLVENGTLTAVIAVNTYAKSNTDESAAWSSDAFAAASGGGTTGGSGSGGSGGSGGSQTPPRSLTEQEIADFTKKYNGWVAEAADGKPDNLKAWMNFAGHPLPDDFYKPINGYIFVRGDGPKDKPPTELKGNGNAVFAVDKDGNMFHVTSAVYQQMVDAGQTPKIHDGSQAVIDLMGVDGVMTSPTVATLYTPTTPTPDPVVPPVVVAPTTPAPADPGNGGSTAPAPTPDNGNNSGNNGGVALTTYTRNANDSGFAYPWSAAQSTGTADVMGTIRKAVTFMNENEGKNYNYDDLKGTIQAEDGSFISKDDVQALNNIIVTYTKQDFKGVAKPASVSTAPTAAGGVQAQTEQMRTIGGARIQDPNRQYGAPGDTAVGTMPSVIDPSKSGIPPIGGM
ncbi:MAG: hypothetical protein Q7T74_00405, partial [Candidatus Saccharibacteria bacterium]|nr:hypothetical protein [Candidatus Saccharibacteria bacterium]